MSPPLDILYVDDDRDIRAIVEMALALDPSITVRTAASGREAIALAAEPARPPDAFILDVMMPDMDGLQTLHALRALPGLAGTPALFMTAKGRDADLVVYRNEGAGVILKPFDPLQLAAEIRRLLERA